VSGAFLPLDQLDGIFRWCTIREILLQHLVQVLMCRVTIA